MAHDDHAGTVAYAQHDETILVIRMSIVKELPGKFVEKDAPRFIERNAVLSHIGA